MKRSLAPVLAVAVLAVATPAAAQPATWEIDPSHSSATFAVKHLMVSTVRGEFGRMSGKVMFDGKDVSQVQAEATIDATSINTRDQKRDDHLRSPDFFDVKTHPSITFKSRRVEKGGPNAFRLIGDLTMRGVTREVALDVESTSTVKDPWGNTRVGARATTTVNRQDYGIKWNKGLDAGGVVVGDEVQITIDLELIRKAQS